MAKPLTTSQETALAHAPFQLTGPWRSKWEGATFRPTRWGIQTVEQEPIRWLLSEGWPATIRRLVKRGLLIRDPQGTYRKPNQEEL